MLANTFWCGPERKKRGGSGETKEWDLLPKRTRKTKPKEETGSSSPVIVVDDESATSSASATSEIEVEIIEECPITVEMIEEMRCGEEYIVNQDLFNDEIEGELLVDEDLIKEEVSGLEEDEIIDIVQIEEIKEEEIVDILDIGEEIVVEDLLPVQEEAAVYKSDPEELTENHFDEIVEKVAAAVPPSHHPSIPSHLINTSPLMLELFPTGCRVIVKISKFFFVFLEKGGIND